MGTNRNVERLRQHRHTGAARTIAKRAPLAACLCLLLLNATAGISPSNAGALSNPSPPTRRANFDGEPSPAAPDAMMVLKQGEPFKAEVKRGETHSFRISLTAGQCAQVAVGWQGADLEVAALGPDGKRLFDVELKLIAPGPLPVLIKADAPGDYLLKLRLAEKSVVAGNYEVRLEAVRSPTQADASRLAAEKLMVEAQRQVSKEVAVEKYKAALQLWREAGVAGGEANALQSLGAAHIDLKQFNEAVLYYKEAVGVRRRDQDRRGEAYALRDLGAAYREFASAEEARQQYLQAVQIFRELGDRRGEAATLYSLGYAHQLIGNMPEALEHYQQSLSIQRAEGYRLEEARTLNNMGGAQHVLGNLDEALSLYQQAAPVWRALDDRLREARMINNVGVVYDDQGDWQQAREHYTEALSICASLTTDSSDKRGLQAALLDNLGELHNTLGDPQAALEKFRESLAIREELKQPRGLGTTLARIGYAYWLQGDSNKALEHYAQALAQHQKAGDQRNLALTKTFIGMAYHSLDKPQDALGHFAQALQLQEKSGERRAQAITLDKMGLASARTNDWKQAFDSYERALRLWREIKDRDGATITLYNIALAERERGNFAEAHRRITEALKSIESQRVNLTSRQLRTAYFANKENYYKLDIDLKMRLGKTGNAEEYAAAALESNEMAHARGLLDILSEARVGLREQGDERTRNFDPQLDELINRKLALQRKLNAKAKYQASLLGGKHNAGQTAAVAREIDELTNEYDQLEAKVKTQHPRYAALIHPQPLTAREIQRQLLDDETLLLEYALGDERSYLWAVTPKSISSYELPGRARIEEVAGRIKKILAESRRRTGEPGSLYRARLAEADAQYWAQASILSDLLLAPVAAQLGNKRLLIVAEGELQYVPFGGLPIPGARLPRVGEAAAMTNSPDSHAAFVPLIVEHEIVNLPSASVLASIRREAQARRTPPKLVAVVADPVFEKDDTRLPPVVRAQAAERPQQLSLQAGAAAARAQSKPESLVRALEDFDLLNDNLKIPRLYASRQEAAGIMALAPPEARLEAMDFKASRATATDPLLAQYRIIHFATHGLLDDKHPELSGVVLSLFDAQGQPQEDGFLRLHDVYNLKLPVELVVLSACQTGLGKKVRGEGLIGLTRGFMYAGASRVVASLWKVDDASTAELMKRFYKAMLHDKMTPAAALRSAQISMWKQARWRTPYFWSGFILQGEWR